MGEMSMTPKSRKSSTSSASSKKDILEQYNTSSTAQIVKETDGKSRKSSSSSTSSKKDCIETAITETLASSGIATNVEVMTSVPSLEVKQQESTVSSQKYLDEDFTQC